MEMRNDGNILVADNGRGSLCIFRECGVFFEKLRLKEIRRTSDIIRQGRTLLVACAGSNSVDRGHLTVYSLCNRILYPGGSLYISDALHCQILRLNLETKAWSGVGFYGNEKGKLKHPAGLLVNDVGKILVTDNGRGSLCKLTLNQELIHILGESKSGCT
jgi:hypothetical protein